MVGWYLYETHLLRLVAELEYAPFLVLTFDLRPQGHQSANIFVRNLGRGPAVSVSIEGLDVPGMTGLEDHLIRLRVPAISPGSSVYLIQSPPRTHYSLTATDFDGQKVTIRYSDPAGRKYRPVVWIGDSSWSDAFRIDGAA